MIDAKIFRTILLIYFTALFSVTFLPKLAIFSALPNLILILSLFYLFQNKFKKGLVWGVLGGLFLDFFGFKFPFNIFITTAIILLAWFLIQRFFESSNIYLFLIFCFLSSLLYNFLVYLSYHLFPITHHIALSALYSTIFGLILFLIYQKRFRAQNEGL